MERNQRRNKARANKEVLHYGALESPVGTVYVASAGKRVIAVSFASGSERDFSEELSSRVSSMVSRSDTLTGAVIRELQEYFGGKRKKFSFFADLSGFTEFQKRVLKVAATIPYGQTRTYGWVAGRAGSPQAARAVGQVMARNPVPIIIPCHRVIGSSGNLCGFGGGLNAIDLKRTLLALEGVNIRQSTGTGARADKGTRV